MKIRQRTSRVLSASALVLALSTSHCSNHIGDARCDLPCALISDDYCVKAAKDAGCAAYELTESAQHCGGNNLITVPDGCNFKDCDKEELTCPSYPVLTSPQ